MSPEYIFDNWTDEILGLMCQKLSERKEREVKALKGENPSTSGKVSDSQLFKQMGPKVKVVKKRNR